LQERHDLLSRPDVVHAWPATWEACLLLGFDPETGEPLERIEVAP
jgi:hypothetical protein